MDADEILEALRPAVLVVDDVGTIEQVHGGNGGFVALDLASMVGTSVFEYVAPDDQDDLAAYFVESASHSLSTLALPLPFRVSLVGGDGDLQPVDVIPAARRNPDGGVTWVVTVVPFSLETGVTCSLEAEMTGVPRAEIERLLTEELAVDNTHYTTRWFFIDLSEGVSVTTSRAADHQMACAITDAVRSGWEPWANVAPRTPVIVASDELPVRVADIAAEQRRTRIVVVPVHLERRLAAVYLMFGSVPEGFDSTAIEANVQVRIQRLVDATALLLARWNERDRLVAAATRDSLTGLANRDAFDLALADAPEPSTVLYVDLDRFKSINDRFGHAVGDRVLIEVANRIVVVCRPDDVVARHGGDEFVVLLRGLDLDGGRDVGTRIRARVAEPLEAIGGGRVTASVGVAGNGGEAGVDLADRAMLRAKERGRDRLEVADPA